MCKRQLKNLKSSNETANIKTSALSAISNSGAVNAEQMLSLLQYKLKKNDSGDVVVLNGGVEQDLGTYIGNLKNPGSGWEHHFKPSSAAGMGAKPSPTSNVSPGMPNPWKEGTINITRQMTLESTEPDLAAVLKKAKSFKASKLNLMMSTKRQMTNGKSHSKTKGNGKTYGKRPTKQPKKKTSK